MFVKISNGTIVNVNQIVDAIYTAARPDNTDIDEVDGEERLMPLKSKLIITTTAIASSDCQGNFTGASESQIIMAHGEDADRVWRLLSDKSI